MTKTKTCTIIIVFVVAALCCLTVIGVYIGYRLLNKPESASNLLVYFVNPDNNSSVQTGEPVYVHIIARGDKKVSRVEFWVNGSLVANEHSPLDAGISPFPLVTEWIPPADGTYTLITRAYDADGNPTIGQIQVNAASETAAVVTDRDGDGYPDEVDLCPDEAGLEPDGCPLVIPDADGDGVEDTLDECPDIDGVPISEGCPDADGDGIDDEHDACPDAIGAGDSPAGIGCPAEEATDRDGDGIPDLEDTCPDEAGAVEADGCPAEEVVPSGGGEEGGEAGGEEETEVEDRDGDGIPDDEDRCPDEAGPAENEGCPEGAADRDGDGFPDSVDLCPDEAGVDPDGCPAPGTESTGEEGIEPGDMGFVLPPRRFVEFQTLSFSVQADYDEVQCYATITSDPPELYGPFHVNGERSWDITEYMGSILLMNPDDPIPVLLNCEAFSGPPGHPVYHYLGQYVAMHPEAEWDGRVQTAWVESSNAGGMESEGFSATYRICAGSCAAVELPTPYLVMREDPFMGQVLAWSWGGDETLIDHFNLYNNGTFWRELPRSYRGISIADFEPDCGEEVSFQVSAAAGENESALSNVVTWAGPPGCRIVRITFDYVTTHGIRDGLRHGQVGPVRGSFWAGEESLDFDADAFPYGGFTINYNGSTNVMDLFQTILDEIESGPDLCGGPTCGAYYAPEVNYIEFEISEGEDLTVGVLIKDADTGTDDTLIDTSETIPYEQIMPSRRVLSDSDMELVYWIDVVAGSGSSLEDSTYPPPDLRISTVENHFGQLAARVENIGEGPMLSQPLYLEYIDRDNGDLLFEVTYENVDIPVGGFKWLSTGRSDLTLYGTVARINSEHTLEESEYGNNNFFTPTLMQFSLTEIFDNSHCDPYWHDYSEHQYGFWVILHLDSDTEISIANLRYPRTGYVRHEYRSGDDYLHPAEDDNRFNFQYPFLIMHQLL